MALTHIQSTSVDLQLPNLQGVNLMISMVMVIMVIMVIMAMMWMAVMVIVIMDGSHLIP